MKNLTNYDGTVYYIAGNYFPLWSVLGIIGVVVFGIIGIFVYKKINWIASLKVVLCFYPTMLIRDKVATIKMHWFYNENRDFFSIWGLPVGEFAIFYIFPAVSLAIIYYAIRKFKYFN